MARVSELGLTIDAVVHTHAHLDHFLASGEIKRRTGATLHLHAADKFLWDALETQCQFFGIPYQPAPDPDQWLEHEQPLETCAGSCIHTPGHTPGSMSFHFPDQDLLIAGDTLFMGSVGRTDLPGGDSRELTRSIQERLYRLDEATRVIPGHGPTTTIGQEMRHNAFVRA